jgi:phage repressor protein C with HTH and peptisase S24 domain
MPGTVVSIDRRRQGAYVLLDACLPGRDPQPAGVLLIDPATGRGYVRLRSHFDDLTDDTEVLDALAEDLEAKLHEVGAEALLASLEDSLSNVLRVSERRTVEVDSFLRVLDNLFDRYVEAVQVEPYRTHLPVYTLRAAAGFLSEEGAPEPEGWAPAPAWRRPSERLFVAHVDGQSMEPLIPDGSLNLFSLDLQGSRQGKVVLIERFGTAAGTGRYSVKRYTSRKAVSEEGWEHGAITFVPQNHDFEPWSPEPGEFRIIAEWLGVVE